MQRHRTHYELSDISKLVEPAQNSITIYESQNGLTEKKYNNNGIVFE